MRNRELETVVVGGKPPKFTPYPDVRWFDVGRRRMKDGASCNLLAVSIQTYDAPMCPTILGVDVRHCTNCCHGAMALCPTIFPPLPMPPHPE